MKYGSAFWKIIAIAVLVIVVLSVMVIGMYIIQKKNGAELAEAETKDVITRLDNSIDYVDGIWDGQEYRTIAGQTRGPVYVISRSGFVLVRNNPVAGLLDVSDYRFAGSFPQPQKTVTPTGEAWRMYSQTIFNGDTVAGVIAVGYRQPEEAMADIVDRKLIDAAKLVAEKLTVGEEGIKIGEKPVLADQNMGYEIVTTGNKVVAQMGNIPAYIDPSYIEDLLLADELTVADKKTGQVYDLWTQPVERNGNVVGLVVVGQSKSEREIGLRTFLGWSLFFGEGVFFLTLVGLVGMYRPVKPVQILELPPDSNQRLIYKTLLAKPEKKFEYDELAEVLYGEGWDTIDAGVRKKIYDAVRAVNAKSMKALGREVIEYNGKTYRLKK